jgi:hypothetical protein
VLPGQLQVLGPQVYRQHMYKQQVYRQHMYKQQVPQRQATVHMRFKPSSRMHWWCVSWVVQACLHNKHVASPVLVA